VCVFGRGTISIQQRMAFETKYKNKQRRSYLQQGFFNGQRQYFIMWMWRGVAATTT
jgi:hypothetical protein